MQPAASTQLRAHCSIAPEPFRAPQTKERIKTHELGRHTAQGAAGLASCAHLEYVLVLWQRRLRLVLSRVFMAHALGQHSQEYTSVQPGGLDREGEGEGERE